MTEDDEPVVDDLVKKFHEPLDHVTDLAGIITLGILAYHTEPSAGVVGAITTISLGKQYAKYKWQQK